MGLQAAPEMEAQFQGEDPNQNDQSAVDQIGTTIVQNSPAGRTPYKYDFHLLADQQTVNAFALPGGQVFITRALYNLLQSKGELAGVLGHEISHVVARHSAEQIAKVKLTDGLTGAAVIASYDPNNPSSAGSAQIAMLIGQMINLKYSRDDELEADKYWRLFYDAAGFDPNDMIKVMQILQSLDQGGNTPEFFSTHPNPASQITRIQEDIQNISSCPQ